MIARTWRVVRKTGEKHGRIISRAKQRLYCRSPKQGSSKGCRCHSQSIGKRASTLKDTVEFVERKLDASERNVRAPTPTVYYMQLRRDEPSVREYDDECRKKQLVSAIKRERERKRKRKMKGRRTKPTLCSGALHHLENISQHLHVTGPARAE